MRSLFAALSLCLGIAVGCWIVVASQPYRSPLPTRELGLVISDDDVRTSVSLTPSGFDPMMDERVGGIMDVPLPRVRPAQKPKQRDSDNASLLERARKYLGTNPTGWRHVWCARFMAMIAPEAARKVSNPNMARAWAELPHTKAKPGAIVVLSRGHSNTAGHIGVIKSVAPDYLIVISGNHNRTVGEGRYPTSRVVAIVSASL